MGKFINTYDKHSKSAELIENDFYIDSPEMLETFIDMLSEGKKGQSFWKWSFDKIKERGFDAPKVKEFQQKANDLKLEAANEFEPYYEAITKLAISKGKRAKDLDFERLHTILQKNIKLLLDNAAIWEKRADDLAYGNEYLLKVISVMRAQGEIDANEALKKYASNQLASEIEHVETDWIEDIKIDLQDIRDLMQTRGGTVTGSTQPAAASAEDATHQKNYNPYHKAMDRFSNRGFTEEMMKDARNRTEAAIKHTLLVMKSIKDGEPINRKSSSEANRMNDEISKILIANPNADLADVFNRVSDEYARKGLLGKRPTKK